MEEKLIRRESEQTREALSEKLGALEQKVVDTVQEATSAVSDTVEAVKESVSDTIASVSDSVKDSVQTTVSNMSDSVKDGVDAVKSWFDVEQHVRQHPWGALACSVGVGFLAGRMLGGSVAAPMQALATAAQNAPSGQGNGNGHGNHHRDKHRRSEPKPAATSWFGMLAPEIEKLKSLAIGTLLGTVREVVAQAIPGQIGEKIEKIIDSTTEKFGGEPMPHSASEGDRSREQTTRQADQSLGASRWQG